VAARGNPHSSVLSGVEAGSGLPAAGIAARGQLDLLVRSLLALGSSEKELAKVIASAGG